MPENNNINFWANRARNSHRIAQAALGYQRLKSAEDGLANTHKIADAAERFKTDREGQRNLAALVKELTALRDLGLRETAHQLAGIITAERSSPKRKGDARSSLKALLERYGVKPAALGLDVTLLAEPPP